MHLNGIPEPTLIDMCQICEDAVMIEILNKVSPLGGDPFPSLPPSERTGGDTKSELVRCKRVTRVMTSPGIAAHPPGAPASALPP